MAIERELLGMHIRRVAQPAAHVFALELHSSALRGSLLIGLDPGSRGLGWTDVRSPGAGADPWLLKWKRHLVGGRVMNAAVDSARLRLDVQRGEQRALLEIELGREFGLVRLSDGAGTSIAQLRVGARATCDPVSLAELDIGVLRARADAILQGGHGADLHAGRAALSRALRDALRRAQRKLLAIHGDLERANDVPALRRDAGLLLSNLHLLSRDTRAASLVDHSAQPPRAIELVVAPELGPAAQAEAWFQRARKLERGAAIARERARAMQTQIGALDLLAHRVAAAATQDELAALRASASELGVRAGSGAVAGRGGKTGTRRVPYREFVSGGRTILVGKGARENDRLTLDHTRPHDLWLHARDESGAHVVVPLERGENCPSELLVDAATLAAHFSRERGQSLVDVLYTERRYVRKPRKSAAGLVTLQREKVMRVRIEPTRLQRLLGSERKPGA